MNTFVNFTQINGRRIASDIKPYIVAEISANHNGSIDEALKLISLAKAAGADAVKIQSYEPDTITLNCNHSDFQIKEGIWKGQTLYELYSKAYTPFAWHKTLFQHAKNIGITLFSSPFDESAVDLLESLHAPAYKIASFEMVDLPLIKCVAKTKKPMIISTGMASEHEIYEAIETARTWGCNDLIVLHCVSAYPSSIEEANLSTIRDIAKKFKVIAGLSDHTRGVVAAITAVALGACFIEKHFTFERARGGVDSEFSLEPEELKTLCLHTSEAWAAIGKVNYGCSSSERSNLRFRRSLYAIKKIRQGELISRDNVKSIRPGFGLHPKYYDEILGRTAVKDINYGQSIQFELLD